MSTETAKPRPSLVRRLTFLVLAILLLIVGLVGSFYRPDISKEEMRQRWADPSSQFLDVLGTEVHVRDEAPPDQPDAPVVVLLHGTASSLHTWDGWVRELGDDYRIVRFDLQGYGLTGPNAASDYTIDRQIEVGEAVLDRLGVASATIGGNSLGGQITWRWALDHPERMERLILVDAAGIPMSALATEDGEAPTAPKTAFSLGTVPVVQHLITKITPRFLIENSLEDVYGDDSKIEPRLVQRHFEMLLAEGNRQALQNALRQRREAPLSERDQWRRLPEIHQPTLILWGGQDQWIPVALGTKFDELLADSEIVVYPDAGHVPMEEVPVESARDVRAWLKSTALHEDPPEVPETLD